MSINQLNITTCSLLKLAQLDSAGFHRNHGPPLGLADAADELAEQEHDAPLPQIPAEDVQRIYMSLYHAHVPKLVDAHLVRYDQDRDLVLHLRIPSRR